MLSRWEIRDSSDESWVENCVSVVFSAVASARWEVRSFSRALVRWDASCDWDDWLLVSQRLGRTSRLVCGSDGGCSVMQRGNRRRSSFRKDCGCGTKLKARRGGESCSTYPVELEQLLPGEIAAEFVGCA